MERKGQVMQFAQFGEQYLIRLEKGEEVLSTLSSFVNDEEIKAGVVSGIGAVRDATLGYFDPETNEYIEELFEGSYEVASISGSAGLFENNPILHLHASLADRNHSVKAGHLFSATVSATLEIHIAKLPGVLERRMDEQTGLKLLHFP
jgi:predicted DNA-binding protein with PD1-like motif